MRTIVRSGRRVITAAAIAAPISWAPVVLSGAQASPPRALIDAGAIEGVLVFGRTPTGNPLSGTTSYDASLAAVMSDYWVARAGRPSQTLG